MPLSPKDGLRAPLTHRSNLPLHPHPLHENLTTSSPTQAIPLLKPAPNLRSPAAWQIAPDPVARALNVSEGAMIQVVDQGSGAAAAGLLGTRRGLGGIVAGEYVGRVWGARGI